jgi:hypothetical protein
MIFLTIDNKFMALTVFKLDATEFNKTIDKYIAQRNVDFVKEANKRAANIIMKAMFYTKRTNPARVVAELGAIEKVRLLKSGKETKAKRNREFYKGTPAGYKIFNWRRKFRPESLPPKLRGGGLGGKEMGKLYNGFVKAAKRSCNYVRAGWLPALNTYKAVGTRPSEKEEGGQQKKSPSARTSAGRGYAKPAKTAGDYIKTIFVNTVNGIEKIGRAPLRLAFRLEEQDMKTYIERKEQERLNKLRG